MIILFRSCEINISPGSLGTDKEKPRWKDKNKLEILRKCYKSIQGGLVDADKIIVVNDSTSEETLQWMQDNTEAQFEVHNIRPLAELRAEHAYPDYHPVVVNSAQDFTEKLIKVAEENPNELIYACEDDYLHRTDAIKAMKVLFNTGYNGFYLPYDYPDNYADEVSHLTELRFTVIGHLRTVPSATMTIAAPGKLWSHYKYEILRAGVFADDSWTYKAFNKTLCLAPVPSHATHLQEGCISPVINWLDVYDSIEI